MQFSFTRGWRPIPYQTRKPLQCTCARAIMGNWVSRFGVPHSIHSNQGRSFESRIFKQLFKMLQIKKTRTTAFQLKTRVNQDLETWDQAVAASMMSYCSSVHASTGYTPFALTFGRDARLRLYTLIGEPTPEAVTRGEFVSNNKHRRCQEYRDVHIQLQAVQLRRNIMTRV